MKALDTFEDLFGGAYEKAVTYLHKDQEELLSFFQFPPEILGSPSEFESNWDHVCDRTQTYTANQGMRQPGGDADNGLQAGPGSGETLAETDWINCVATCINNDNDNDK